MVTTAELQAKIEKLDLNMDRFDAVMNGPVSGPDSQVELDGAQIVPTLPRALDQVRNSTVVPTLAEVSNLSLPVDLQAFVTAGRVTAGDGFAGRYVRVASAPDHDNWVTDAQGQIFALDTGRGYGVLKLSAFLDRYKDSDPSVGLLAAFQTLWDDPNAFLLDCEGICVVLSAPFVLDKTKVDFGMGRAIGRTIVNMNLRADPNVTWPANTALFTFRGDAEFGEVEGERSRSTVFSNCKIDASDAVDFGIDVGVYYHLTFSHCLIRAFKKRGFYARHSDTLANGLVLSHVDVLANWKADYARVPECGIYLEDGDVVVEGGWVTNTRTGLISSYGAIHVKDVHFSLGRSGYQHVGIYVTAPRGIFIRGCDFDGCNIVLENIKNNTFVPGTSIPFGRIQIISNEFVTRRAALDPNGLIILRAYEPDAKAEGLICAFNSVLSGEQARVVQFGFNSGGSWSSDFNAFVFNPGDDPTNLPGRNIISRTDKAFAHLAAQLVVGANVGSGSRVAFSDPTNRGAAMPYVGSKGHALIMGTRDVDRWTVHADTGIMYPVADNAYSIGRPANRLSQVYAATGSINTSDARQKKNIRSLSSEELAAAMELADLISAFQFNTGARTHIGWIAQQVIEIFAYHGLDAFDYGMICYDDWGPGNLYGIRYEEMLAFVVAGQQQRLVVQAGQLALIESRLLALETAP